MVIRAPRVEQRQDGVEHRAADVLEIDVDAGRAGGGAGPRRRSGLRCETQASKPSSSVTKRHFSSLAGDADDAGAAAAGRAGRRSGRRRRRPPRPPPSRPASDRPAGPCRRRRSGPACRARRPPGRCGPAPGRACAGSCRPGRATPSPIRPYSAQPLVLKTRSPAAKPSMRLSTTWRDRARVAGRAGRLDAALLVAPLVGVEGDVDRPGQGLPGPGLGAGASRSSKVRRRPRAERAGREGPVAVHERPRNPGAKGGQSAPAESVTPRTGALGGARLETRRRRHATTFAPSGQSRGVR